MGVSTKKSKLFKSEVEYLVSVVSSESIKVSPLKADAIKKYPVPVTMFGVRSFLGLTNYCLCFIKDYANVERPSIDMLKRERANNVSPILRRFKLNSSSNN